MKNLIRILLCAFTLMFLENANAQTVTKDSTGKTIVSSVLKSDVVVFPNPSAGLFYIRIPSISSETNIAITVYDQKGDIIMSEEGSGNIAMIDIHEQPTGLYTVYVSGDGVMSRQRVSVVK